MAPGRNVAFSVVLRPSDLPTARAPELTLVASLAVCDALRRAGVDAGIKWPNDLLVGGRKIAGILTELAAEPDQVQWVVVGVGVNVNARSEDFPPELRGQATSVLLERGQPAPRALFLAACLTLLEEWYDRHAEEGFEPIRQAWKARSVTLGREVLVQLDGREVVGRAEDLDAAGALLVRTATGARADLPRATWRCWAARLSRRRRPDRGGALTGVGAADNLPPCSSPSTSATPTPSSGSSRGRASCRPLAHRDQPRAHRRRVRHPGPRSSSR